MKIRMLLFAFAAGLFSISTAVAQDAVYTYNSEEGKCSVNFPTQFTERATNDEYSKSYKATSKLDGMLFMMEAIVFDMDAETEREIEERKEEFLIETVKYYSSKWEGKIIGKAKISKNGVEGIVATVTIGEKKMFLSVYLKGNIQYILLVVESIAGILDDKLVNSFKNSFEIF